VEQGAKKVLKHFPFIPKLKWMLKAPNLFKLMMWHHDNRSKDGYVRHVVDSKA
jgi:hypothetical protein